MSHLSFIGNLLFQDNSGHITVLAANDMNVDLGSTPQFYDHSMASSAPNMANAAPQYGHSPIQKKTYRYSPIAPKITASGIWAPHHNKLLESAITVPQIGSRHNVSAVFFMDTPHPIQTIYDAVLNSLNIEIKAGEPVTWNAEFMAPAWDGSPLTPNGLDNSVDVSAVGTAPLSSVKALTWDACEVFAHRNGATTIEDIQSFSISIKNNAQNVYTNTLAPYHVRVGIQEVTGSITTLNFHSFEQKYGNETITFKLGDDTWKIGVVYASPSNKGAATSLFASTINFTGTSITPTDGVWLSV